MSRSWQRLHPDTAPEFQRGGPIRHAASNLIYQPAESNGRYSIVESRPPHGGAAAHELLQEVHYAIGSGNHARAFAMSSGGYLNLVPINWYVSAQAWDFNPGFERHNRRFDRPVLSGCMDCHRGESSVTAGSFNQYEDPLSDGIGCERCHGPGGRHVAERSSSAGALPALGLPDPSIVNPGRLEVARQNDLCFLCHLSADVRWARTSKGDFTAGQALAAFRADYFVEPEDPNAVGVASHGARMAQSRCYTESGGRLSCISCHDPHRSTRDAPRGHYDAQCLNCHSAQVCPPLQSGEAGHSRCIECHMPARSASNAPHVVFTEHWIRAAVPGGRDATTHAPKPKRLPNGTVQLRSFWRDHTDPADLGIAYIAYYDQQTENQATPDLNSGRELLRATQRRGRPLEPEAEYWMGVAYGHLGQWDQAIRSLESAAPRLNDPELRATSYARLGAAYQQTGRTQRAAAAYERLLSEFPENLASYQGLAPLMIAQGDLDRAIALCEASLSRQRNQPAVLAHLAFAQMVRHRTLDQSLDLLQEAQRGNPDLAVVYFTRAGILEMAGDSSSAKQAYSDAYRALARVALMAGDAKAAQSFVERALESTPGNAGLIQWQQEILSQAREAGRN